MSIDSKQLANLANIYREAVYGGAKKEAPKDTRLVVTAADKKANTPAYKNYKAGHKGYKAADHLKDDKDWGYDKKGNSLNPVDKMKKERKKDELTGSPNVKKESFVSWRQDLKEIPDYEEIPLSQKKRNEKISEKSGKNEVKINPEMKESVGSAIDKGLGAVGDTAKVAGKAAAGTVKVASKVAKGTAKAAGRAVGTAVGVVKSVKKGFKSGADTNESVEIISETEIDEGVYEKQKTKEVMGALKKRDLKKDVKKKIAADIVKKKGDTSKSDDRYAYESKLWDQVAANLTELGELNNARFKVEGYQRNPEKGEAAAKKADTRSAKQKRMDSPDKGINSPAFKEFMKQYGG